MRKRIECKERNFKVVALLTNHDDDIYCFRKELIEALITEGYRLVISCPYGEKLELMDKASFIHDDLVIDRRGTNIWADFKLLVHYRRMMCKYRPDIVLTYTSKPNVYGSLAAMSLGIPYINNVTGLGSVLNKNAILKNFIMKLFKTAFRKSSCIFFQNEENMKLALQQGLVKGKYKLIPGSGVNTNRYPLQPYPQGGNGYDGEQVVFNYIGRVLRDKGIDNYLEAAKRIRQKFPQTEFNVIGFIEPTEEHYRAKLDELERDNVIKYRGSQKDVKPWIGNSHAIIHPSVYGEGMSNVLLENASSGRPIITTDNPGCRETVDNRETGYIYKGNDVEELIDKISQFLKLNNSEREEMGKKGRMKVKKSFERKIVVDAYLKKISEEI